MGSPAHPANGSKRREASCRAGRLRGVRLQGDERVQGPAGAPSSFNCLAMALSDAPELCIWESCFALPEAEIWASRAMPSDLSTARAFLSAPEQPALKLGKHGEGAGSPSPTAHGGKHQYQAIVKSRLRATGSPNPSPVLLRDATPSVFHQRHIGRMLRSSCGGGGRRAASSCGREPRPSRCPPLWPGDLRIDGGRVAAARAGGNEA